MISIERPKGRHADDEDWRAVKFVIQARGENLGLKYVQSSGKRLVATDGKRLHTAKLSPRGPEIPAGVYDVIESKDRIVFEPVTDVEFPDWWQVWPKHMRARKVVIPVSETRNYTEAYHAVYRAMSDHRSINVDFLNDILATGHSFTMAVSLGSAIRPLVFRNGRVKAIVMPMEVK